MGAHPSHPLTVEDRLSPFLEALRSEGFSGEIAGDQASRTVYSTDNSIYQVPPAAVVFPRDGEDVARLVRAAARTGMPVTPRGGGTGTNGQSLTSGVCADLSRHMNRILSLDLAACQVTIEPGVVLDQLNAWLKPHGLFFPPTVSTASRATIGGMVATDASGKGSRIYGRTSDYIETLDVVLSDGTGAVIRAERGEGLRALLERQDRLGGAARTALKAVQQHGEAISRVFPRMNRGLTGYNLQQVLNYDGAFRLQKLLAGSEGTLAVTRAITLRLLPRPACRGIAVLRYASFTAALDDISRLILSDPAAIEIMDDKVLALAREDVVWSTLESVLGGQTDRPVAGLNVVEFVGESEADVAAQLARLEALAVPATSGILDQIVLRDAAVVSTVWDLRKKAVGLLGRLGGVPFIEDTAVPPESLPAYVKAFRALLDGYGLDYAMFGHADVGCLHVRPVLDLRRPEHAALIRPLTDAVAALTIHYGGLLWGEHGRGFRGEYSPEFFGPELYPVLSEIKAAFDPLNLFNPGKLSPAVPGCAIDRIDTVPFRGQSDRHIAAADSETFGKAVACNGNGACHGWDAADLMCPSYKGTRDRNQSPKGRAALLREWARRRNGEDTASDDFRNFERDVGAALETCLSCKACSSLCPVRVDIPEMKSAFLERYHATRPRSLRDRAIARMEPGLLLARRMPRLINAVTGLAPVRQLAERLFGLVDLPRFVVPRRTSGRGPGAPIGTVILLEDLFTSSFDGATVEAADRLLTLLGYRVTRIAPMANGKALQVRGFRKRFEAVALRMRRRLVQIAKSGHPIVSLDAATGLMFGGEYRKATDGTPLPAVLGIEQFLAAEIAAGRIAQRRPDRPGTALTLLTHCTEKAARPLTPKLWTGIFSALGLSLETPATGCCGMAGLFGHEKEHKNLSESLFRMSWQPILDRAEPKTVLASGFSCRCQTERVHGVRPRHPVEALLDHLTQDSRVSTHAAGKTEIGTVHAE